MRHHRANFNAACKPLESGPPARYSFPVQFASCFCANQGTTEIADAYAQREGRGASRFGAGSSFRQSLIDFYFA